MQLLAKSKTECQAEALPESYKLIEIVLPTQLMYDKPAQHKVPRW